MTKHFQEAEDVFRDLGYQCIIFREQGKSDLP